jgi:hypothetical protein
MDGTYDTGNSYILRGIGIRPRANARTDRGPPERRISATILRCLGRRGWSMVMGYGRRWAVETALNIQTTIRRTHHLKKHRKRAKSIYIT